VADEVWMSITKETPVTQQLEAYLAHGSGQASPRRTTSIDHGKNHPSLAQLKGMSLLMLKACDMFEVAKVRAGAGQKISGPLSWDLMVTYCRMQVGKMPSCAGSIRQLSDNVLSDYGVKLNQNNSCR